VLPSYFSFVLSFYVPFFVFLFILKSPARSCSASSPPPPYLASLPLFFLFFFFFPFFFPPQAAFVAIPQKYQPIKPLTPNPRFDFSETVSFPPPSFSPFFFCPDTLPLTPLRYRFICSLGQDDPLPVLVVAGPRTRALTGYRQSSGDVGPVLHFCLP